MQKTLSLFILIFLLSCANLFADSPFVRYPAINNDGSKIVFSYQGDLWSVPSTGGNALRLTIHEAYDGYPQWSKDDSKIAFSSDRFGNYDVFVMPAEGGKPERLTYHSTGDILNDWTYDNNLLFSSNRLFQQVEWDSEMQKVSADGGTPTRLLSTVGNDPAMSPDGKYIAISKGWGRETREDYRGPANFDIWIYDIANDKYTRITDFDGHDFSPRWGNNNELYFISSRSGVYNIYKTNIAGGSSESEPVKVTNFNDDGARYFNISGDGSTLVMERLTDVYLQKLNGSAAQKVNIQIGADYRFDPFEHKTYTGDMDEYSVSPNGKYTAFVVRGEVFVKENDKEKSKAVNLTNHPYRDQNAVWLSDSTLIFVSDRDGQKDLYLLRSVDEDQVNLFKSMKHEVVRLTDTPEDESFPVVSPDGKKLAYEIGSGKLVVVDVSDDGKFTNEVVLLDGWDAPGNVCWSPDSRWLSYSLSDLNYNSEIYIHAADNSQVPVNVSMHPRTDYMPVWSPDGKKLGFISERNNKNSDVWFVWLSKKDWEKTQSDWEDDDDSSDKKNDKKKKDDDSSAVEPITIDFENIYQRLVQVTSLPGDESSPAISKDGETFYFVGQTEKGRDLYSIKWNGKEIKNITSGGKNPGSLTMDKDVKYLYYTTRGKLNRLNLSGDKEESLPFSGKMKIIFAEEYKQKFEEGWRAINQNFYDPDFHGKDWGVLKEKYKPLCLSASTQKDFQDMFNIMLGELNASHMGLRDANDRSETQKERTGLLGVELEPLKEGMKITHVVPRSPADKEKSKLNVDDVILSVDGEKITKEMNFYSLMTNKADEKVLLEVENSEGDLREVVIRPTRSLSNELYDEWVDQRKDLVEKYSNGRLGYLHIEGMSMPSFERFERELTARGLGKEGIVIDVRFNGGGWTTDYLMTVLNYKQHAYTIPRGAAKDLSKEHKNFRNYYPLGERLPFAAWTKPSIALCNQNSYSNAEIFSHAYKNLGIGTLVGYPTFGAVISTGAQMLIDGSYVRLPGRGWYVLADDSNMENGPAVPDIIVEEMPDSKANGRDEQLKRAVDELLNQIESK